MGYQTINFADVESFEPLPEGEYDVEIDKVELRKNKAGDGEYLNWEMSVIDGEYENRKLWLITSLKPKALFRLKQVFEDLDVLEDDEIELEYDDDVEPSTSGGPLLLYPDLEGIEAVAVVKNEMYDGKERNRVNELFSGKVSRKKSRKDSDNDQVAKANERSRRKSRDADDTEDEDDDEEEEAPQRRRSASNGRSSSKDSSRGGRSGRRRVR